MNEPPPKNNPSDTGAQMANMCAILKSLHNLNKQETAEAIKLKTELERLISRPFRSTDEVQSGIA